LLQRAGHDVLLPVDIGTSGVDDALHLTEAVKDQRVLLTHNHQDFENLHRLVLVVQGHHPGILTVCRETNPRRDLNEAGIVRAIARLLASAIPLVDHLHVLNHWR